MNSEQSKFLPNIKELAVLAVVAALMVISKLIMEFLPNMHLVGVLIVAVTAVYRFKAIYAVYTFVFVTGFIYGFAMWWLPYIYVWAVLWGFTMLVPKDFHLKAPKISPIVYMVVCSLHGFLYGILYAPSQALLFGLDFKGMIAWIVAGIPFDTIHGISNLICGILILPIIKVLRMVTK